MSLDGLTLEKLKDRKKELESQASFLEDKFRAVLLRSPSQRPCPITLKGYVEKAFKRIREDESSNPLPYKDREEIRRAISQEGVIFTIDYLQPYLIHRLELDEIDKQLRRVETAGLPTESSGEDELFVFQRQDEVYWIIYQGRKFPHVKATLGFKYIAELLSGKMFYAPEDLGNAVNETLVAPPSSKVYSEMSSEQLDKEVGLHFPGEGGRQEKMDNLYIKECREDLQFTLSELEKAKKNNDPSQIEKLGKEKNQLLEVFKKDLGLFGRSRQWDGPSQKAQKSISKNIHRAIKKIEKIEKDKEWDLKFSRHLKRSLTPVRFPCRYSPDEHIDWQT